MSPLSCSSRSARVILWGILCLCVIVRLWGMTDPLTGVHAWRQCDTAAVARNFAEEGMNPMLPRVDWRGDTPGYVEMELPAMPYVAAAIYRAIGVHDWVGRGLAMLGSCLLCLYGHRLVRWSGAGENTSLTTAFLIAALPLSVYYGRAFMPESWMLAAGAAGLFHFARWRSDGRAIDGVVSAGCIAAACLLKVPSLVLGLPLAWLACSTAQTGVGATDSAAAPGIRVFRQPGLWLHAGFVLTVTAAWYWWAGRLRAQTGLSFGIWDSDKYANWHLASSWTYWHQLIVERLAERHLTWVGAAFALAGILRARTTARERLFDCWCVSLLISSIIVARGNSLHEYYQLPWTVPLAFYAARSMTMAWRRGRWPLVLIGGATVVALSIGRLLEYRGASARAADSLLPIARSLDASLDDRDRRRVVVVAGVQAGDPSLLYHSRAKGWVVPATTLDDAKTRALIAHGARWMVGSAASFTPDPPGQWWADLLSSLSPTRASLPVIPTDQRTLVDRLRPAGTIITDDQAGFILKLDPGFR